MPLLSSFSLAILCCIVWTPLLLALQAKAGHLSSYAVGGVLGHPLGALTHCGRNTMIMFAMCDMERTSFFLYNQLCRTKPASFVSILVVYFYDRR